ncbi:MAG: MotA/TolQ/ExbB proton channel family protein [Defluviitaleaceae bacterium]|nr:MotA/TolQ/ExbB proton channel family protein [Defluviitaleaceae bacterium]
MAYTVYNTEILHKLCRKMAMPWSEVNMNILRDLIPPIIDNLFGYDLIIILTAIGTLGYFLFVRFHSIKVYNAIHTKGYRPDDMLDKGEIPTPSREEIKRTKIDLRKMRETSEKYYSMYSNLTGIFPLLGILGTVIALIPMVQDMANMQHNFFVALTSTLWGLVFAIFFKVLDAMLAPRIERNNRGIDDYLDKLETSISPEDSHEKK